MLQLHVIEILSPRTGPPLSLFRIHVAFKFPTQTAADYLVEWWFPSMDCSRCQTAVTCWNAKRDLFVHVSLCFSVVTFNPEPTPWPLPFPYFSLTILDFLSPLLNFSICFPASYLSSTHFLSFTLSLPFFFLFTVFLLSSFLTPEAPTPDPRNPASNMTLSPMQKEELARIKRKQLANAVHYIWETGEDKYMLRYFHTGFWLSCEKHNEG